jgi:Aminoglycoside-2''-adenylyltransferase
MREFGRPWFVSGGWAIDLFVGRVTRDHEDVEIGAFARDQQALRDHLQDWDLLRIRNNAWEPWVAGDVVELPDFQLQARSSIERPHVFDVFLNPRDDDAWVSRRHRGLRVGVDDLILWSVEPGVPVDVPFLAPEIQLLYKAKYHPPKDDADFTVTLPHLDTDRRRWLRDTLLMYQTGDPWIPRL